MLTTQISTRELNYRQQGLSFIELMIVIVVSSIILVGVLIAVGNVLNESANSLQKQRLNYELQNVMKIVSRDIRRAGYWSNAKDDIDSGNNTNPHMIQTSINIVGNNCILLGYDIDSNGALPAVNAGSDDERYGFRLDAGDSAVEGRILTSNYSCTSATGWEDITDPDVIQVSNLTFSEQNKAIDFDNDAATPATLNKRKVDVSITGNLTRYPSISLTLTKSIYVYNSKYVP